MKFLQYKNSTDWWMWPEAETLTVYNINGGHHDIDENSKRFIEGTVIEAKNWSELCRKVHWNPFETQELTTNMWIDPDGVMYDCNLMYDGCHEITAQKILEILYGEKKEYLEYASDDLIAYTWVKVTTSLMFELYEKEGMYNHMSDAQWESFQKWKEKFYGKLY